MTQSKTYRFVYADECNMCRSDSRYQVFIGRRLDRSQGLFPNRKSGITTSIFQCKVCSLIYANPMPIPEDLGQHYDVAPEEYWSGSQLEVTRDYFEGPINTYFHLSDGRKNKRTALDIGAGLGKTMIALSRAGFEVSGIEPSPQFRNAALERMGIPSSKLTLTSVESADFPPDSFDFINFGAVLEHLVNPAQALEKTVRWLKPGGLMYVEVPSAAFLLSRLVRLFYRMAGNNFVINTCPMHVPYHLYEFGLESFLRHGAGAGYSVALHHYYPCADYMPRLLIPTFNAVMNWTNTGMQLAVWLKK